MPPIPPARQSGTVSAVTPATGARLGTLVTLLLSACVVENLISPAAATWLVGSSALLLILLGIADRSLTV